MRKASMTGHNPNVERKPFSDQPHDLNKRTIEIIEAGNDGRIDIELLDENGNVIENSTIRVYAKDLVRLIQAVVGIGVVLFVIYSIFG